MSNQAVGRAGPSQAPRPGHRGGGLVLPPFRLELFLQGRLEGWGVQETRSGEVQSRFSIEASGSWDEKTQTLSLLETRRFDDGHADTLSWSIRKRSKTDYVGTEARVVGRASGEHAVQQFRWYYRRRVPDAQGRETTLDFEDIFVPVDTNTLLVTSTASRFFVTVGRGFACYRRLPV